MVRLGSLSMRFHWVFLGYNLFCQEWKKEAGADLQNEAPHRSGLSATSFQHIALVLGLASALRGVRFGM